MFYNSQEIGWEDISEMACNWLNVMLK